MSEPRTRTKYLYDALGRRTTKSVGTAQTNYIYGLDGNVISEVDQSNVWMNVYLRMNGQFIAQYLIGSPRTQFILSDHLGSARVLTKYDGTLVDSFDFLPFGEQIAGASVSTHKFTGDERDSETALDHTWFRQYSSSLGRWMHPDPAGIAAVDPTNPQSWNRYAYVQNNPLNAVDPSGLSDCAPGEWWDCGDNFNWADVWGGDAQATRNMFFSIGYNGAFPWLLCDPNLDASCGPRGWCDPGIDLNCGLPHFTITLDLSYASLNDGTTPPLPSARSTGRGNACIDSFNNSTVGRFAKFFSPINLILNTREAWPDWTVIPLAKVTVLKGAEELSSTLGNTEFLSLTGGSSVVIEAPTAAGIGALESVAGPGLLSVPAATAFHAGALDVCKSLPNIPFFSSLP